MLSGLLMNSIISYLLAVILLVKMVEAFKRGGSSGKTLMANHHSTNNSSGRTETPVNVHAVSVRRSKAGIGLVPDYTLQARLSEPPLGTLLASS